MEHRSLTLPDYLVWGGFICALGWFACSTRALYILIDHPLDEETRSDSVEYLKVRKNMTFKIRNETSELTGVCC